MNAGANAVRAWPPAEPARPQNWPQAPAMVEPLPVGLVAYPTIEALAEHCVQLLRGRPFLLSPGRAGMAGFDTFPKVTVWAQGDSDARQLEEWLGAAVLLSPGGPPDDVARLQAAIEQAQAAARGH